MKYTENTIQLKAMRILQDFYHKSAIVESQEDNARKKLLQRFHTSYKKALHKKSLYNSLLFA